MAGQTDRRDRPAECLLEVDCLEDQSIRTRINVLRDLVSSCRGPQAKAKVIQNSVGGHVTWTKMSARLFSTISFSTPVLKVMISSFQGHIDRFKDCGLFTAEFCLTLVKSSLELNLHRRLMIELYEEFALIIDNYLNSNECACKFDVDVFNINHLMTVLKSMCVPKLSHLNLAVQNKLCILFLDVFLSTIPSHPQEFFSDQVYIQCFENSDMSESVCLEGLLIECPELSSLKTKQMHLKTCPDLHGNQRVKVVLVTESMSGDSSSFVDAVYEVESMVDIDAVVLERMLNVCQDLVGSNIGLLLCQRVIHPKVKVLLRKAGVLFVDRLGSQIVPYLKDLTGTTPISVISVGSVDKWDGFGWVDGVIHQIWSDRSYLLLTSSEQPIVTLVLKSNIEEQLQEIKVLSQATLRTLQLLLRDPRVVCGGGCSLTHLADYLTRQVQKIKCRLMQDLGCSEAQLIQCVQNFVRCLRSLATNTTSDSQTHVSDIKHHHTWECDNSLYHMAGEGNAKTVSHVVNTDFTSCICGMVSADSVEKFEYISGTVSALFETTSDDLPCDGSKAIPKVVDSLCVIRNAFKTAVATANTVLGICQYIHDPV